jgi:crotonobetainyl-CoA:carnitine CoA-transferase CaiB-like acyl-CoA transferase
VTAPLPGALDGLLVIDASRVLAGPYAAMLLSDLGASVVKIEQPGGGDDTRSWGPPFTGGGVSAYYLAVNRGKRGIAIDLRTEAGRGVFDALLAKADVLIENFKAETREAFALSGESTCHRFPRLVHAAISGFGATGAHASRPGYDNVAQAASGLMSITGPPDGEPHKVGVAVSDLAAGLHLAVAVLAALRHRDATGAGQFVDVSLFDASLGLLANVASSALVSGEDPRRWGNAHPSIVPYQTVVASDGPLMLAVGNDLQFRALARVLESPAWADDPRFATNPARVRHREELVPMIAERFSRRTASEWLVALAAAGIPAGPVRTVGEALSSPEAKAAGMIVELAGASGGTARAVGPVPKLGRTPARAGGMAPRLGEHTDDVLRELLDYEPKTIAALRAVAAIA